MLKRRIIPCLDVRDGRIVKGVNFVDLVDAGDPVAAAAAYDAAGADELCFLDITASHENRKTLYETVERTAAQCFMPLTVGGGVREINDIRRLLLSGADKVAINSAAVAQPEFIAKASEKFGRQCITIAIDARRRERHAQEGRPAKYMSDFEIFTHGGRRASGRDALEFSLQAEALGAGELLVTSMDRDGTKLGYDLELTRLIADAVAIPVIASGGAGCLQHLTDAVRHGHASAVLAASIFHFGVYSIDEAKSAMHEAGIPVRRIRG